MPYSRTSELPAGVRNNLPKEAQSIWMRIFNSAYNQYHTDDKAAATAWAGLKRAGYKQDKEGNWSKTAKKADEAELLKMFLPITKVDESTRTVYMTAASEALDKAGEILDYERSKPNFQKWSADMYARSGGKSYGNIREMHTPIAAGKIIEPISFDDVQRRVDIAVKIVDDNTWRKIDEGVLTGASIGGKYVERSYSASDNAYKYVADISEISMVDQPCNPDAVFQLVKADGTIETKSFKSIDNNQKMGDNNMEKVGRRKDVSPASRHRAVEEYGNVTYADEKNKKYPLDTPKHVRAAASYFGMPKNRAKYSEADQKKIEAAIARAERKFKIGEEAKKGGDHMTEKVHKAVHEAHKVHKAEEVHSSHKCTKVAHEAPKAENAHEAHKVKKLEFVESVSDIKRLAEMLEARHYAHAAKADNGDLQKAGKSYSAKTVKALKAMSHGLGQMGAHCDCEACKAMYKEFIGVKKADEGELHKAHKAHKAHKVHKAESAELQKVTDSSLVKGLVAQVEELKKAIQKLENMPVGGGPVLNAQAVQKGFAGQSGSAEYHGLDDTREKINVLKSLRDSTNDMVMKDAIGRQIAALEMQKVHQNPQSFTPRE
jgi:cation transport regulator ChaB